MASQEQRRSTGSRNSRSGQQDAAASRQSVPIRQSVQGRQSVPARQSVSARQERERQASKQFMQSLRKNSKDSLHGDNADAKNVNTPYTRKFDYYFVLALASNTILLAMWIFDYWTYMKTRTAPGYPEAGKPTTGDATDQHELPPAYAVSFSSPEWLRTSFLIPYVANYSTLLSFIYNTLHHPRHRFRRSVMMVVYWTAIFSIRCIWELWIADYRPLLPLSGSTDCAQTEYNVYEAAPANNVTVAAN